MAKGDRKRRRAKRRAKLWNAYSQWWSAREKIAKSKKARSAIVAASSVIGGPYGTVISRAALEVDRQIGGSMADFAGRREAIALELVSQLEENGTITAKQAKTVAKQVTDLLGKPEKKSARSGRRAVSVGMTGPGAGVQLQPKKQPAPGTPKWLLPVAAITLFLLVRK